MGTTTGLGVLTDLLVTGATAGGAFTTAVAQASVNGLQKFGDELGTLLETVDDTVNLAAGATDIIGGTTISAINRFTGNRGMSRFGNSGVDRFGNNGVNRFF